jgi:hypothetical protein
MTKFIPATIAIIAMITIIGCVVPFGDDTDGDGKLTGDEIAGYAPDPRVGDGLTLAKTVGQATPWSPFVAAGTTIVSVLLGGFAKVKTAKLKKQNVLLSTVAYAVEQANDPLTRQAIGTIASLRGVRKDLKAAVASDRAAAKKDKPTES